MFDQRSGWCSAVFLLCGVVWGLAPEVGQAHPFHISIAEMEFNSKTGKIEVSLKLHASDLEQALSALAGKRVKLDSEEIDVGLTKYLQQHYYLLPLSVAEQLDAGTTTIDEQTPRSKVQFVGKELETSWLWLYFEMDVPGGETELALVNTVLLATTDGQINTVSVRGKAKRHAMKMTKKKPWGEFSRGWLVARETDAS